jgi:hypothetical protein
MIENIPLPEDLIVAIGSESKDFAVKCRRAQPARKSIATIFFGVIWLAFMNIFVVAFFGPIIKGKEVEFTANGVPVVAGPGNLEPVTVPGLIIGAFVLVGFGILGSGIYLLFKKGGYFAGTTERLVIYKKGKIRSIDWEQFSGDIEVNGNVRHGTISLQLRTGQMVSGKNGSRYVPDIIYITGIPNAFEIEQLCRKRIKENDPTPPSL